MSSDNPFASPQVPSTPPPDQLPGGGIWRSRDLLVIERGATLPDRCVKCNAEAGGYRKHVKLNWHPRIIYAALLAGLWPYVLLALFTQKRMPVHAGLCDEHRRRRRNAVLLGTASLFAAIGLMIFGGALDNAVVLGVGLIAIVAALVYLVVATRIIWPRRIDRDHAWVKGVDAQYLAALPEFME